MRIISFYLPQFHPIPENNEWWGGGFTEWTNVTQATPKFHGHYQPHIPGELGFYDLRLQETREAQALLAHEHGVDGFCYYHYWFNGRQLLERPFNEVLNSKRPDFPFCLCWANENWTRAWDGLERQVLMEQTYSPEDDEAHFKSVVSAFLDSRYIRIDGRPIFLIYRPDALPDSKTTLSLWRRMASQYGLDGLYLIAVKSGLVSKDEASLIDSGFDAILDFQPNRNDFPTPRGIKATIQHLAQRWLPDSWYQEIKLKASSVKRIDYIDLLESWRTKPWPQSYVRLPCIFPSWDNTARRKTPTVIQNENPALFAEWIKDADIRISSYPDSERLLFINAWNEWAEGCHLEPDRRHGRSFLQALKQTRSRS